MHKYNWLGRGLRKVLTWLSKPKMLAYTLYSTQFIVFMSTSTGCLQFGAFVLLACRQDPQNHQRLLRFFAATILTAVCLVIYFNTWYFRKLNVLFAYLKIVMICGIIGMASYKSHKSQKSHSLSFGEINEQSHLKTQSSMLSHFMAFLNVLWAFSGWENATFVCKPCQILIPLQTLIEV